MSKIFVASTGQNVGKTTCCLGLFSGLLKRFPSVGFIKPVGQEWVEAKTGKKVDKDILLFQDHFKLESSEMSPVLLPSGFTREVLDGKIDLSGLGGRIESAFGKISSEHPFTLIEGTGHMGVGSLIDLNNAQVAKRLGARMVLVVPGGVGSAFDQIVLNQALCKVHGVELAGVILNKVLPEKASMVKGYMEKALAKIEVPLLGCVSYLPFLSSLTLQDFEKLFKTELIAGEGARLFHYEKIRLIATSVEVFEKTIAPDQLLITHGAREDVIIALLKRVLQDPSLNIALILTGSPPREPILNQIKEAGLACLLTSEDSFGAMKKISGHVAKIAFNDREKIEEAIQLVERAVDFDRLIQNL